MQRSLPIRLLPLLALVLLLSGCVYPISKPLRLQARPDLTVPVIIDNPSAYGHAVVIWGGTILSVQNEGGQSSILVKEYPLDWRGEPNFYEESRGRFLVRTANYLDPAVYRRGRYVTIAGEVTGIRTEKSGQTEYRYPVLAAREMHLWRDYPIGFYDYPPPAWRWGWGPPYGGWYDDYYYDDYYYPQSYYHWRWYGW